MSVRAVIFCKIKHKTMTNVLDHLKKIPEIKKLFSLTGQYDILAEIEVESTEQLYDSFAKKIDPIPCIIKTNTHVVMKSWEK
ncbi:MAG: Lrp/AsnC ligand binding domain-containing protein [Promethearchaeia archaeon]